MTFKRVTPLQNLASLVAKHFQTQRVTCHLLGVGPLVAYGHCSLCFNMATELARSDIDNSTDYQAVPVGVTMHRCKDLTIEKTKN